MNNPEEEDFIYLTILGDSTSLQEVSTGTEAAHHHICSQKQREVNVSLRLIICI